MYNYPHLFPELQRAWAFWMLAMQGYSGLISPRWGYDRINGSCVRRTMSRKAELIEVGKRLENVQLESTDALRIIESRDSERAFFYVDPPYFNSDCGHYDGYTEEDFEQLLILLSGIKGKFIVSSFPSEILTRFTDDHGWHTIKKEMQINAGNSTRKKVEVLTANFKI